MDLFIDRRRFPHSHNKPRWLLAAIGVIFLFVHSSRTFVDFIIYVNVVINVFSISPMLHIVHVECVGAF